MDRKLSLPIDPLLPEIAGSLRQTPNLVLEAPPGAGKTTRVPPLVLTLVRGEVLVLEPRRIAARTAALRVAEEMGERLGDTVGYQVRFEEVSGPRTRLRYVTEGTLLRRMVADPELKGVDAVILDEFHERNLDGDFALALLNRLQQRRPELLILVMSATLDGAPVAAYLGNCPVLRSEGRMFEVTVTHLPYSPKPLANQVSDAVQLLIADENAGHILVFLPGTAEIRQAMRECQQVADKNDMLVLPLHGGLSVEEQDRVLKPAERKKLILATNVAETSVTVDGVTAVIDSGLARSSSASRWTGLPTLHLGRISKASAKQRAGRAGRTGPGRVLRLYAEEDYARRPEYDAPEILRSDLSGLCLAIRAMSVAGWKELEWLDAPPAVAVVNAEALLDRLGAVTGDAAARLARYPLTPRLSRIVEEAIRRSVADEGCVVAALLGSGLRMEGTNILDGLDRPPQDAVFHQHLRQLRRIVSARRQSGSRGNDDELLRSILIGFSDRVARKRAGKHLLLSNGVTAELQGTAPAGEFMVVLDVEDRSDRALPLVRMIAPIEPEWLIDLFPERIEERTTLDWNHSAERVETVSALVFDELVIEESRRIVKDEISSEMLCQKAMEVGIEGFVEKNALEGLLARAAFAGLDPPDVASAFRRMCEGLSSFAELRRVGDQFVPMVEEMLDRRLLRERAPERIRLAGGREVRVHYERDKAPWISSRLQDFFGMKETPTLGRDRTPVVIHLLAPNQRAVQTTTDLAGFWERLYPEVRRTLMRRYPRHQWPERP
ncbi:ATP-dependent helicase HrpB [Edaphobacter sp. 12200R-103]|uniref:ATP-dependent helicase HrpB n=1 Tax=Edaphobacter sp. 12200R-103 TaxID=2703788 RepID=UPI001EE3E7F5|nr:ATP-dependent helicase HrpB [Edaphobacter sp. 12200R-103]